MDDNILVGLGLIVVLLIGLGVGASMVEPKTTKLVIEYPMTTYDKAWEFTENQFPETDLTCSGDDKIANFFTTGNIPQNDDGSYGGIMYHGPDMTVVGHIVLNECLQITEWDDQGRPTSGYVLWRLDFDPNNGRVWRRYCNSNHLENCPPNIKEYPGLVSPAGIDLK